MDASQTYILILIMVLLIIAILIFFVKKNRKEKKSVTSLASIALAFILAGILFGDNRIIGYSLIGVGVIFAVIDIIKNKKR